MNSAYPLQPPHLTAPRPYSPAIRHSDNHSPRMSTGSATQTLTNTPQRSQSPEPLVLRLRGAHTPPSDTVEDSAGSTQRRRRAHIQWAEDVIDNEGLGRKKSKVCCIYHKPKPVGESSDESSSDSSSDSDSDSDSEISRDGARPVGGSRKGRGRKHPHNHHGDKCGSDHGAARKPRQTRRPSPNAYEKMPKYDVKPLTQQPGR